MASHVPTTVDAVLARLESVVKTWDGPVVSGDFDDAVFVGYDGDPDGEFQAIANHVQSWASLGAKKRNESFSIICAVCVLLGDDIVKVARDKGYAMLAQVEDALRADPSVGQLSPFVASIKPSVAFTEPTENGMQVRIPFTIDVEIARV